MKNNEMPQLNRSEAQGIANEMKKKMKPGDNNYDEAMNHVMAEKETNKQKLKMILQSPDYWSDESINYLMNVDYILFCQVMHEIDDDETKNFSAEQKANYSQEVANQENLHQWRTEAYYKASDRRDFLKEQEKFKKDKQRFESKYPGLNYEEYLHEIGAGSLLIYSQHKHLIPAESTRGQKEQNSINKEQSIMDLNIKKLKAQLEEKKGDPLEYGKLVHSGIYNSDGQNTLEQYLFFIKAEQLWHEKHSEDYDKIKPILDLVSYKFIKEWEQQEGKSNSTLTAPDTKNITFSKERLKEIYSNDPILLFRENKWRGEDRQEMGFIDKDKNHNVSHVIGTSGVNLTGLLSCFEEKK